MGDSEIKNLLERANAQVHIDEARKKKAHQAMMMEMEKQKINKQRIEMRMSLKNILLQQFQYMDKLFFYISIFYYSTYSTAAKVYTITLFKSIC